MKYGPAVGDVMGGMVQGTLQSAGLRRSCLVSPASAAGSAVCAHTCTRVQASGGNTWMYLYVCSLGAGAG